MPRQQLLQAHGACVWVATAWGPLGVPKPPGSSRLCYAGYLHGFLGVGTPLSQPHMLCCPPKGF